MGEFIIKYFLKKLLACIFEKKNFEPRKECDTKSNARVKKVNMRIN